MTIKLIPTVAVVLLAGGLLAGCDPKPADTPTEVPKTNATADKTPSDATPTPADTKIKLGPESAVTRVVVPPKTNPAAPGKS